MDYPSYLTAAKQAETFPVSQGRRPQRSIVLALDGTGDQFDNDNSNVVQFFSALKKDDPNQITYYQAGIGTYTKEGNKLKGGFSAGLDMAVGSGLGRHVRDAYEFLMSAYQDGDLISIIGFSRGSYTARSLAGMLHKVGLLPKGSLAQVAFAYKQYKMDTPQGWKMSAEFKRTFSIDVHVHFLGLWDTVASVGFVPRSLPFSKSSNEAVVYVRHALALDEHRAKFKAAHWFQHGEDGTSMAVKDPKVVKKDVNAGSSSSGLSDSKVLPTSSGTESPDQVTSPGPTSVDFVDPFLSEDYLEAKKSASVATRRRSLAAIVRRKSTSTGGDSTISDELHSHTPLPASNGGVGADGRAWTVESPVPSSTTTQAGTGTNSTGVGSLRAPRRTLTKSETQALLERRFTEVDAVAMGDERRETDVEEVWFAGAHADCGGGAVRNGTRHCLSRVPLRWMIRQTFLCNTGIIFHTHVLAEFGLDIDSLYPIVVPRTRPFCSPPPSALDNYARGTLPSLASRSWAVRRRQRSNFSSSSSSDSSVGPPEVPLPMGLSLLGDSAHGSANAPAGLPEAHEDYFDALSPINDQLAVSKPWWILELWPVKRREQTDGGQWIKKVGPNLGRYRAIRDTQPKMHWTVIQRAEELGYQMRNTVDRDAQWQIVA